MHCDVSHYKLYAMSGFYAIPKVPGGGHQALPVKDSWYEERSQHPANLLSDMAYPIIAVCQRCFGRIRLATKNQMEWVHLPTDETQGKQDMK
jgi:hypothetical protein